MEPFIIVDPGHPDRRHRRRRCTCRSSSSARWSERWMRLSDPRSFCCSPVVLALFGLLHRQLPERRHPSPAADAGARLEAGKRRPARRRSHEQRRRSRWRRRARAARRAATRSRWYENIPLVSWLCAARPLLGLQDADLGALSAGRARHRRAVRAGRLALRRRSRSTLLWCGFCALLVALACIDWDTTLPARRPHPARCCGPASSPPRSAGRSRSPTRVWGAVAGYLSLWSVYWLLQAD